MPFTSGNILLISRYSYVRLLLTHMQFYPMTSPSVIQIHVGWNSFLRLTFVRIEIEHWGWSQCVSLGWTDRLICNMTFLAHHVTLPDVKFWLSRFNVQMHIFRRVSTGRRGTRWHHNYVSSFLCLKVVFEKTNFAKGAILAIFDFCSPTSLSWTNFDQILGK